jgi:hypothetical protein
MIATVKMQATRLAAWRNSGGGGAADHGEREP